MIPIPGFMNLDNKLILNQTCVLGYNSNKTSQFSTKMRAGFAENDEVGLEN